MLKMSDIKLSNLFVQCLAEKYEYIAVIMAILSIYMFIDEPIYIFIATTILLIFIFQTSTWLLKPMEFMDT